MSIRLTHKISFLILLIQISCLVGCGGGGGAHLPPVIQILTPASSLNLTGIVRVSGKTTPDSGYTITKVTCQMDAGPLLIPNGLDEWWIDINTTKYIPGLHTFTVRAEDSGGESTLLLIDMYIKSVPGGNGAIINALLETDIIQQVDISDQLTDLEGSRFTYLSMTDSFQPVAVGGWMVKPIGYGPFPCIIYNRSGLDGNASLAKLETIAQRGYVVFASDYQGHGDFASGAPDLIGGEIYDCIALLLIARRIGFVNTSKVYIWGDSRGSAVTLITLDRLGQLQRSNLVKAAAVTATVYDIEKAAEDGLSAHEQALIGYFMGIKGLSYEDALAGLLIRSPGAIYNHDDIVTPLFIGHGSQDEYYPPFHSYSLDEDMTAQGVQTDLNIYQGFGHLLIAETDVLTDIISFWNML